MFVVNGFSHVKQYESRYFSGSILRSTIRKRF